MKRPFITLKLATSLDGKIALANGQSEWITGAKSRAQGRKLRASHDAIAVGSNTAVLDNPQLTTRIAGAPNPVRVIFDSRLRLSPQSNLALTANDVPVWVFSKSGAGSAAAKLRDMGVRVFEAPGADGHIDIAASLDVLRQNEISRLLLEGGGTLAASFIKAGFVDIIEWFRAPIILGGDGRSGVGPLGLESLDLAKKFTRASIRELGDDMHERYERVSG